MKLRTGLWSFAVLACLGMMASCSSDSDDGDDGGGGSDNKAGTTSTSGRAGASSGGSVSNGGSTTAGRANGGSTNNAGSNNNGGRANNGGTPGSGGFNFGGAGFDPEEFTCDPKPTPGSTCAAGTQPCIDGTEVCYCQEAEWGCTDIGQGAGGGPGGGFGEIECPATKPMSGGDCGDTIGFCPYGNGQFSGCACYNGAWMCN